MARPRSFDRDEVLDRICDLFWERGYAATSLTDLENASGLKRTSLYNAFGNKEELYATVLDRYRSGGETLRETTMTAAPNAISGIVAILSASVEQALADAQRKGCFINNATNDRAAVCTRTAAFVADNRETFVAEMTDHLRRAEATGHVLAESPEDLAVYLFSVYSGLMSLIRGGADAEAVRRALRVGLSVLDRHTD